MNRLNVVLLLFVLLTVSMTATMALAAPGPPPTVPEPTSVVAVFGLAAMGLASLLWGRAKRHD